MKTKGWKKVVKVWKFTERERRERERERERDHVIFLQP
jgi:hypothetical protein